MPVTYRRVGSMNLTANQRLELRFSMRVKIQLIFFFCLAIILGCAAETFNSSSPVNSTSFVQPSPTMPVPVVLMSTENEMHSQSGTTFTTYNPVSVEEKLTSGLLASPKVTVSVKTSIEGTKGDSAKDDKSDEAFKYDYSSLRQAGLFMAAVLFLMGIAVLTCGRMCRRSKCHVGSGKFYEVNKV